MLSLRLKEIIDQFPHENVHDDIIIDDLLNWQTSLGLIQLIELKYSPESIFYCGKTNKNS